MKKYLSLLIVLTITVFIGVGIASAATSSLSFSDASKSFICTDPKADSTNDKRSVVQCEVYGVPTKDDSISFTDHFEVVYNQRTQYSDYEVVEESNGGTVKVQNNTKISDSSSDKGGTWDLKMEGLSVTNGTPVKLFTINIYGDISLVGKTIQKNGQTLHACGGYINRVDGGSNTSTDTGTVTPSDTGFTIPVVVLGIGTLAGLAILAVTSRKPKMHRI